MGTTGRGMIAGKCRAGPSWNAIVLSIILLLAFLILPSIALAPVVGAGPAHDPAGSFIQGKGVGGTLAASPTAAITVRPTPLPARQNRTTLLTAVAKNPVERPKVTVPASWVVLIVAIAFIGIGTILYLLLRNGSRPSAAKKKTSREIVGHATILDEPAAAGTAQENLPAIPGPAVQFPPSLEKRFLNPEFIGEGGLARVFRAKNAKTRMTVAVKVPVRFDEVTGTHFTRDIVFWQGLEHENIVRIYSSNILPVPYIEMEYAPSSLAALPLPLSEEKAVELILGIARGLAYAHGKGIVHRDIKPENILIASDGTPKITDWGLGKAIADPRQSSVIGFSPSYAAPEQIAPHGYGKPGPATDIYQLGMLLCEMLTGSVAFDSEGMHDLHLAILNDIPVMPSWNGRHEQELKKIILRCLSKKPEDRYASVVDLIRDLEAMQVPE